MNKQIIFDILCIIVLSIIIIYLFKKKLNLIQNYSNDKYEFIDFKGKIPIKNIDNPTYEMKKYNVIIAGTVRNVEEYIQKNIDNIDKCGKQFNEYLVIIYENDSNDDTRNILINNKKSNYIYLFEDDVEEPLRTKRISDGRNKILEKIREINKTENNKYQYMIMIDLDDRTELGKYIDSIKTCFQYSNWDVLTGNQSDKYYDLWALRKKNDMEGDCWKMARDNINNDYDPTDVYVNSKFRKYESNGLLEVDSAFGGIAIYKLSSIPDNCNYVGKYEDGNEICEHVEFNRCIKKSGKNIYINTDFLTN